jgi:hypothetical protein
MFETNQTVCELVLFWDGESIDRSMVYSDFEATLDNIIGMPAYSREVKRATYLRLNTALKIVGCVLFTIGFEDDGFPERSWNIPLRHLVEVAARGPDLGAGPIQLACRTQCPISWHAPALWDPVMGAGFNTLELLREEAVQAASRFGFRPQKVTAAAPATSATETDFPILTDTGPVTPPPPEWEAERNELQRRLREEQLRGATLETDKNETINRLGFLHQQQVDILEAQNSKVMAQLKAMKAQGESQRDQVEALRNQLESLNRLEHSREEEHRLHVLQLTEALQSRVGEEARKLEDMLARQEQEASAREARVREEHRLSLERRLEEEASRHQAQLVPLLNDLRSKEDSVQRLSRDMAQMLEAHALAQQTLFDTLLRELAGLGMNFVVFHAGVGTISVPVSEIAQYMQNPLAYAAGKCLVTEMQYRTWLKHYENPRCMAAIGENKCCDARLIRIDSPTRFIVGQSDHCARHQPTDAAIANVLRFR